MASHNSVKTSLVTVATDVAECQPRPHPASRLQKFPDLREVPEVKTEVNIPEEQVPQCHPMWNSLKSVNLIKVKTEVDASKEPLQPNVVQNFLKSAALMEVKTEADLSEEQQPHPVHDLQESPDMIKVQVKADIAEEPPKHHPVHDSQVKSPHLVEMSQVKIEVDIAEEPPVPWMTASLIHSKCCELALFDFVELVHFKYVHLLFFCHLAYIFNPLQQRL